MPTLGECTNEKDLLIVLESLRQERLNSRREFETIWWNNIALVAGDHYTYWEPNQGNFVLPPKEDHEVRLVLNQARVVARTELAKVLKSRPIMEVMANSSDETDIAAARVGRFALEAAEWKFKLRKHRKTAMWWTILCGCACVYTGWDPDDARDGQMEFLIDPNTNEPVFNPNRIEELENQATEGVIDLTREQWPLGDLCYKVYSPFQMLPDDTVLEFEDVKDMIVTDVVDLDIAKSQWGRKARDLSPDLVSPGNMGQRFLRRVGLGDFPYSGVGNKTAKQVVQVHTWWLPPNVYKSRLLKDGIMIRWANGHQQLEVSRPFPYADGVLPFAFFTHIPNAISLWPDAVMTDIRPINLELDKTISQLLENRDYMLNPMWAIAAQSQVKPIKSQPGGEVRYVYVRDVPPPSPIPGTPMPTQIENLVVGLRDQILDISGQGEISRGRLPSGVRAGNMMAYLQEEDETKLATTVEGFEDAVANMGSQTLSRYAQYYHHERLLRAYKPGGQADVRKFKGADLKNNTDVNVVAGSALPKLKSARQAYVMQLAELGIETDPKRIKDMLELGEGEPDEVDLAFAQAERENEIMRASATHGVSVGQEARQEITQLGVLEGQDAMPTQSPTPESAAVPVKEWHNHEAHLKRHIRFMMTVEFEKLTDSHPDIVRLFDEHVTMHQQKLQEQQAAQLQMMLAARGGPEGAVPPEGTQPADAGGGAAQRS